MQGGINKKRDNEPTKERRIRKGKRKTGKLNNEWIKGRNKLENTREGRRGKKGSNDRRLGIDKVWMEGRKRGRMTV